MTKVLIADDEAIIRDLLRLTLLEADPELDIVAECANGREAVDQALQQQADIVFLDVRMPILDGLQAGRLMKEQLPDLQIVYVSAFDEFHFAQQAIDIGTVAYILKPVALETLQRLLLKLQRKLPVSTAPAPLQRASMEPDLRDPLADTLTYIDNHLSEDLSLATLARFAGFHPAAFSRAFKREFGVGLSEYITRMRMEFAQTLLVRYPRMSIQEITERCGFSSAQYFAAVFRSYTESSPNEFRTKWVNKSEL